MSSSSAFEEELLQFLYACPVGLIECRSDGEISMINPHAMLHLLPLARERSVDNLFVALERHAPEIRNLIEAFAPTTGTICDCHRIIVDLGSGRRDDPKVLACTIVKLGEDRIMATLSDVSAQFAQERRLQLADAWFSTLLDRINDYAVLTISVDGMVDAADDAFTRQTGFVCNEVIGRPLATILRQDETSGAQSLAHQLRIAAREGWFLEERWQERKSGERYWCQRLIVARIEHRSTTLAGFSVVLRDVPHREAATAELRRLLNHDHLTGAANRAQFRRVLEREKAQWRETQRPLSLVLIDLDHFKSINDTHGHPAGDVVLRKVAEACMAVIRPRDLLGRLGGEEFGVLLPGTDLEAARAVAEDIRLAISALLIDVSHGPVGVTASLGCATLSEAGGSIDDLIRLADERLYEAKRSGRDRVVVQSLVVLESVQ
jgi:diguanylate cyclase (GGDEF)-like protein/PAS domain S-box-containing protein